MKVKIPLSVVFGLIVLVVVGLIVFKNKNLKASKGSQEQATNVLSGESVGEQAGENLEPSGKLVNDVREIEVSAKQWEFIPNPIVVNYGEKVRLRITSTDVAHGFALPEFGVDKMLRPGEEVTVEFEANKKGKFSFLCSVYCGVGHGGMRGELVVK